MSLRYRSSEELHARALKSIPLGSQTFSKSRTQYPVGAAPLFAAKGSGAILTDVDGNEYVDFVNSLAAITLGYNDPDVTAAVRAQLDDGTIFSLPHRLETEVAERIIDMVPCAEAVRFGKNGSDATAGAIRVARAHTGRDHIAVCGYHGWQDWYIGSTPRHKGVPSATRALTHSFAYNDMNAVHKLFADTPDIAAVIMEPMNATRPDENYMRELKEFLHKHGALLIFDETITGFRYANGGAQEWLGVTPDLATFGKGLANGYPISAVAGRADVMKEMEEVFFSFTFGGETLSLAAAKATLDKLKREPVIETMWKTGGQVMEMTARMIAKHGLHDELDIVGLAPWSIMPFKEGKTSPWLVKTYFLQEVFRRGVLMIGTHNMSYAHNATHVAHLEQTYDAVFAGLRHGIDNGTLESQLECEPLVPLFKLR